MASESPRLIEVAFPLKQASLDSVHEKNVRHGHISTLHIWPARRPLAACRAALIATLLPDPGDPEKRQALLEKLAGKVVQKVKTKRLPGGRIEEQVVEETEGGILHWGRETENAADLEWFRQAIREAYGGRAPKVMDPFAGGGAIPLEAMRLGCEATAIDINPVAWFILKCTLEYPQKLAGQKRPLPDFIRQDPGFMVEFFKAQGLKGNALQVELARLGLVEAPQRSLDMEQEPASLDADLAWHVRAWGWWVLKRARADLQRYYPTVDGKTTVAYLWARTVTCKNCRATLPLLKTRWLCKKERKRVLLTMKPNAEKTGVEFGIQEGVPQSTGNARQRVEHDKQIGKGTLLRSGATCPCCGKPDTVSMTMEDIRLEGQAGRLGAVMTAVVVDNSAAIAKRRRELAIERLQGLGGGGEDLSAKEYRLPTEDELRAAVVTENELQCVFAEVPFGMPEEPVPEGGSRTSGGSPFTVFTYGLTRWRDLFTPRQLLALGMFVTHIRETWDALRGQGYPEDWTHGVGASLVLVLGKMLDYGNALCSWYTQNEQISHLFNRFALPMKWDYAETSPIGGTSGSWASMLGSVDRSVSTAVALPGNMLLPRVIRASAVTADHCAADVVVTDPPYYDAIPYSDVMDFFYVWHRRALQGLLPEADQAFTESLGPKWDRVSGDGELIDDPSRFEGDSAVSKAAYEDGMARAFGSCYHHLSADGVMVIVFANKQPDAWETLASSVIRAGFVVVGSWPVQTEMVNRTRAHASSALASSVWLVCKKRPEAARAGWDNRVLEEMRANIATQLRAFWDAGIRGPDFVWPATGPAMDAYSKHPVVKKANAPGQVMTVSEFLSQVRRIVVDFVVGRVLSHNGGGEGPAGLDDPTTYYLLHRHDFGMAEAPIGPCILYAVSCGLSDGALADQYDLLARTGGQSTEDDDEVEDEGEEPVESGSGGKVRLKPWNKRLRAKMGYEGVAGRPAPLIDQAHRLMLLWKAGNTAEVEEYLDTQALRRNTLFHQLLQALIELAPEASEERALLESISNELQGAGCGEGARGTAAGRSAVRRRRVARGEGRTTWIARRC